MEFDTSAICDPALEALLRVEGAKMRIAHRGAFIRRRLPKNTRCLPVHHLINAVKNFLKYFFSVLDSVSERMCGILCSGFMPAMPGKPGYPRVGVIEQPKDLLKGGIRKPEGQDPRQNCP